MQDNIEILFLGMLVGGLVVAPALSPLVWSILDFLTDWIESKRKRL